MDTGSKGFESWVTYVLLCCHLAQRVTFLGIPRGFEVDGDDLFVGGLAGLQKALGQLGVLV